MSLEKLGQYLIYNRKEEIINSFKLELAVESFFKKQGMIVNEDELQNNADDFRQKNNLLTIADFDKWVDQIEGYSLDDFERYLLQEYYKNSLFKNFFKEYELKEYFDNNLWKYYQLSLSIIITHDIGIAEEIYALLRDENYNFQDLASKFSIDLNTAKFGGRYGNFMGRDFSKDQMNELFISKIQAGEHLILIHESFDKHKVIKIDNYSYPIMDEYVIEKVREDFLKHRLL